MNWLIDLHHFVLCLEFIAIRWRCCVCALWHFNTSTIFTVNMKTIFSNNQIANRSQSRTRRKQSPMRARKHWRSNLWVPVHSNLSTSNEWQQQWNTVFKSPIRKMVLDSVVPNECDWIFRYYNFSVFFSSFFAQSKECSKSICMQNETWFYWNKTDFEANCLHLSVSKS